MITARKLNRPNIEKVPLSFKLTRAELKSALKNNPYSCTFYETSKSNSSGGNSIVNSLRKAMQLQKNRFRIGQFTFVLLLLTVEQLSSSAALIAQESSAVKGWKKGQGWGWVWGKEDEVGALNALNPQMVLKALSLVK